MFVSLELSEFRNLDRLEVSFGAGHHLITGPNGAGKTSLLEALYLLATTKSFRTAELSDCIAHRAEAAELRAETTGNARVALALTIEARSSLRQLNGREAPLREHLEVQAVVSWTTSDALLWTGSALDRRRFIDRGMLLLAPGDLEAIARVRQLLRQKRLLLARRSRGVATELEVWNQLLAAASERLQSQRARFVAALQVQCNELLGELGLGLPEPQLRYRPSPGGDAAALAEAFAARLEEEVSRGRPLLGPQRDELEVWWDEKRTRKVASGGERKALGLIIAAAQAKLAATVGRQAVVLLDDVDAELDRKRLEALWPAFRGVDQLFASSSRPELTADLASDRQITLAGGKLA